MRRRVTQKMRRWNGGSFVSLCCDCRARNGGVCTTESVTFIAAALANTNERAAVRTGRDGPHPPRPLVCETALRFLFKSQHRLPLDSERLHLLTLLVVLADFLLACGETLLLSANSGELALLGHLESGQPVVRDLAFVVRDLALSDQLGRSLDELGAVYTTLPRD